MKILIAYDGSVLADEAMEDLDLAGMPPDTEAMVLCVASTWSFIINAGGLGMLGWDPLTAADIQKFEENSIREAEVLAHRARNHLELKHPDWVVTTVTRLDQPASGILAMAETWNPDLIVMGSHGRSALVRLLLGSVAHKVLHHAQCAVRINRARIRPAGRPPRILLGIGGADGEERMIEAVAARVWPTGSRIHLLAVEEIVMMPPDAASEALEKRLERFRADRRERVQGKLARLWERFSAKGLEVYTETAEGDPRHVLLEKAAALDADCVFLGSRKLDGMERVLLGSVSDSVAGHAHCTVEVHRDLAAQGL